MSFNQKMAFQKIRNYLAGRAVGATRDEALLDEVMKCLMVKKVAIINRIKRDKQVTVCDFYRQNFRELKTNYWTTSEIELDDDSISYIDDLISEIDFNSLQADPVGDLFEAFVGASIRGSEGQFFTPQNAAKWLVDAVSLQGGESIIDPACGAGGFLVLAAAATGPSGKVVGIEKDDYLASLARARMEVLGIPAQVYCANSLSFESKGAKVRAADFIGKFDVVLTNPPFGKNIVATSISTQKDFRLGMKWKRNSQGLLRETNELATKAPPQVLFIERILTLLKPGGRAGVVVPESLLSNRSYAHVVEFLRGNASIEAVVGMPEALFKHSGKGGTHTKTALLVLEKGKPQNSVFMAEAKWCGNDSRGRKIEKDDLPTISADLRKFRSGKNTDFAYTVAPERLSSNILSPRYHEPAGFLAASHLHKSHDFVTIGQLLDQGALEVATGDEVGKLAYGTGPVPFIRTSDISGWELKIDSKHCVSEEVYLRLKHKQDVRPGDLLMVRDGTYLIGSCAFITDYDCKIVYQSHILKFRCNDEQQINPYLLLAIISSDPVQRQIKSKTFTQDIIDSLGSRYQEIILPIPKEKKLRDEVTGLVQRVIEDRVEARELARKAREIVAGSST